MGLSYTPSDEESVMSNVQDLRDKTIALVSIDGEGEDENFRVCTGVWVSKHAILTANHCVEKDIVGQKETFLTYYDVKSKKEDESFKKYLKTSYFVKRDADHDIALLMTTEDYYHTISSIGESPKVGEVVYTMGHPLGLFYSYSVGTVAAIRKNEDGTYIQATVPISPGNSGGALFNSEGEIIGMCDFYVPSGQNLNFFTHVKYIRQLIKDTQE